MSIVHPCGITLYVEFFWDNTIWTDNSDKVRSATIQTPTRPRGVSGVFDPGRAAFTMDNRDRTFDPLYTSGSYYGDLKPGRLCRVRFDSATTPITSAWWGFVDRFSIDYHQSNKDSTSTVSCVDELSRASWSACPAGTTPGLTDGENIYSRLGQIAASYNYGPEPNPTGTGVDYVARFSGQSKWDATRDHPFIDDLRRAVDVEQGVALSGTTGGIDVWDRNWFGTRTNSRVAVATFGAGNIPFYALQRVDDSDDLVTAVAMTDEDGNAVVAIDATGEQDFGTRYPSVSMTDLPSYNDEDLEGAANTLITLAATEVSRIQSLVVKPGASAAAAAAVASLQPLDRITVTWTPTNVGSAVSSTYFIDGITHQITPDDWTTTYQLRPTRPYDTAISASSGILFRVGSSLVDATDRFVGL